MTDKAKSKYMDLNDFAVHYQSMGRKGYPVVLLHGLASTRHIWDRVMPWLASDFRVFAMDQRGHGECSRHKGDYSFSSFVSDLRGFLRGLRLKSHILVGHSWGANIALEYAVEYPRDVKGLVMVDGGFIDLAGEPGMTWEETQKAMALPDFEGTLWKDLVHRVRTGDWQSFWGADLEQVVLAGFRVKTDGTIEQRLARDNHLKILRGLWDQHPGKLYPRVKCPVLVVAAKREPSSEREANFIAHKRWAVPAAAQGLASSRVLWMSDSVHDVPLQRPVELAKAIREFAHVAIRSD